MKAKAATVLMAFGLLLVAAALGLFLRNEQEQKVAGDASQVLVTQLVDVMQQRQENRWEQQEQIPETTEEIQPVIPTEPPVKQMPVEEIGGYDYVGVLWIEALQRELPVMADWSDEQLKIAPCRFSGSTYTDDLVIMAHNYNSHFGGLHELQTGDEIAFTDIEGITTRYQVVALDVLDPEAVEEMTAGDYDLSLFTCTYGGQSRVTVRCDERK